MQIFRYKFLWNKIYKYIQYSTLMSTTDCKAKVTPLPSVKQLREAIPKHCFERSALRNCLYILRDLFLGLIIGYAAILFIPFEITPLSLFLWGIYAYVQGTVVMGLWVLGHECGHGAFSSNEKINDTVGFILHTGLLVPYFSWQRTHKVHHSKCNHLLDGQTHIPNLKKQSYWEYELTYKIFGEDGFVIVQIINHLLFGWPLYLFFHATGSRRSPVTKEKYSSIPNHFNPLSNNQLFPKQLRFKVFLSSLGMIAMVGLLIYLSYTFGMRQVVFMYIGPYIVINAWLVTITWLQHTDPSIPHFGQDQWEWLKGATMTVDRNYPWLIEHLHHRIGTTHVCHHIFHQIPHYHAVQATNALKKVLGTNYRYDPATITQTIWRLASQCHYVDQMEGVQYIKSFLKEKKGETKAN